MLKEFTPIVEGNRKLYRKSIVINMAHLLLLILCKAENVNHGSKEPLINGHIEIAARRDFDFQSITLC